RFHLRRKLEIEGDEFPQQSGHNTKRHHMQCGQVLIDNLARFRRIGGELLGFEITWKHDAYKTSLIGLPCASEGLNPIIAPSVGTRSVESTARSKTTFSRMPAPATSSQVVRERASPVR